MTLSYGYEITSDDVWAAHDATMAAAEQLGQTRKVKSRMREIVRTGRSGEAFVAQVLGRKLGLR